MGIKPIFIIHIHRATASVNSNHMKNYTIQSIPSKTAYPFLLNIHYAKRIPSISFCFGLFKAATLKGVCCFDTPASSPLLKGIAGDKWAPNVIELNRLVLIDNEKNLASYFVSRCLKKLPKSKVVVSYADTGMNHAGYVYQACNFIYTGLSAKRTDWKVKGKEHLHGHTIADEFRGFDNRVEKMRAKYGDDFYLQERPRKHRYIYFVGSKSAKKQFLNDLNYSIEPYPKSENKKYKVENTPLSVQGSLIF
jgi:hypothetical protein